MATRSPELSAPGTLPEADAVPKPDLPHASDPVAQTLALLHPWIDFVPMQQRRLGLFIFLALLAHLVLFFFIRIDATRAELRHEIRTHVTVESARPATGAASSDAFWDQLTDPRLFLLPVLPLAHLSTEESPLDFSTINSPIGSTQLPPSATGDDYPLIHAAAPSLEEQVQAAMRPTRQPFFYDQTPPVVPAKTAWQWGDALAQRQPVGMPDLPSVVSDTDLNPTELRVAVDADGAVRYVLLEQTCQKPDLDQQAILAARKVRFQPTDEPGLTWGKTTVFWHVTAPPREIVVPTPPTTGI